VLVAAALIWTIWVYARALDTSSKAVVNTDLVEVGVEMDIEALAKDQGKVARAVTETLSNFYGLSSTDIHGISLDFRQFKDHVLLITNVASF
jgi:hypothetical protein